MSKPFNMIMKRQNALQASLHNLHKSCSSEGGRAEEDSCTARGRVAEPSFSTHCNLSDSSEASSKRGHPTTFQRETGYTHTHTQMILHTHETNMLACSHLRTHTHTHKHAYETHTLACPHLPHLPKDPLGQGLSTVSPFRVGGHCTPRATRLSHPPT